MKSSSESVTPVDRWRLESKLRKNEIDPRAAGLERSASGSDELLLPRQVRARSERLGPVRRAASGFRGRGPPRAAANLKKKKGHTGHVQMPAQPAPIQDPSGFLNSATKLLPEEFNIFKFSRNFAE